MKTIAYDNSKRIVNVRYYLYGSNGKIEKMYSRALVEVEKKHIFMKMTAYKK